MSVTQCGVTTMLTDLPALQLRDRVRTTDTDRVGTVIGLYPRAAVARLQFDNGAEDLWSVPLLEPIASENK
jgi:hypothetical protein